MSMRDLLFRVRVGAAKKQLEKKSRRIAAGLITRSQKKFRERFRKPIRVTLTQDFWVHPPADSDSLPSVYYAQGGQSTTQRRVDDPAVYAQVMRAFEARREIAHEVVNKQQKP